MADAEVRGLERRFSATGALDDEARLLEARRRVGALRREQLELAAWLGQPAAREVLGEEAPAGVPAPWQRWAAALGPDGLAVLLRRAIDSAAQGALTRAGLAACQALEAFLQGGLAPPAGALDRDLEEALDAALDGGALAEAACLHDLQLACAAARAAAGSQGSGSHGSGSHGSGAPLAALLRRLAGRHGTATAQALVRWALGPAHAEGPLQHLGLPEAARWLRALLAREALPRGRLLLAAWAGDPAAREALGDKAPDAPEGDRAFLEGVLRLEPELAARLAAGLLVPAVLLFQDVEVGTAWFAIEEAEHAVSEWLAAPAHPDARRLVRETLAALRGRIAGQEPGLARRALEACALGLEAALEPARAPAAGEALLRFATRSNAVRLRRRLRHSAVHVALDLDGAAPTAGEEP